MGHTEAELRDLLAEYLRPFMRGGQYFGGDIRQGEYIFDLVIKENGGITHVFEVKKGNQIRKEWTAQLGRIRNAISTSWDGGVQKVRIYLALWNDGEWKFYSHDNLTTAISVQRALRKPEAIKRKEFETLKWISITFGGLCGFFFFAFLAYLLVSIEEIVVGTGASSIIWCLGVMSLFAMIFPFLLPYLKRIAIRSGGLEIEFKDVSE